MIKLINGSFFTKENIKCTAGSELAVKTNVKIISTVKNSEDRNQISEKGPLTLFKVSGPNRKVNFEDRSDLSVSVIKDTVAKEDNNIERVMIHPYIETGDNVKKDRKLVCFAIPFIGSLESVKPVENLFNVYKGVIRSSSKYTIEYEGRTYNKILYLLTELLGDKDTYTFKFISRSPYSKRNQETGRYERVDGLVNVNTFTVDIVVNGDKIERYNCSTTRRYEKGELPVYNRSGSPFTLSEESEVFAQK